MTGKQRGARSGHQSSPRTSGKPELREGGQRGELALGGERGEAGREEGREGGEKSTSRKQRER